MEIRKMCALLLVLLCAAIALRVWLDWEVLPARNPAPRGRTQVRLQEITQVLKGLTVNFLPVFLFLSLLGAVLIWHGRRR